MSFSLSRPVGRGKFANKGDVALVQTLLSHCKKQGKPYYRGRVDGQKSRDFEDAICAFQADNGLAVTGFFASFGPDVNALKRALPPGKRFCVIDPSSAAISVTDGMDRSALNDILQKARKHLVMPLTERQALADGLQKVFDTLGYTLVPRRAGIDGFHFAAILEVKGLAPSTPAGQQAKIKGAITDTLAGPDRIWQRSTALASSQAGLVIKFWKGRQGLGTPVPLSRQQLSHMPDRVTEDDHVRHIVEALHYLHREGVESLRKHESGAALLEALEAAFTDNLQKLAQIEGYFMECTLAGIEMEKIESEIVILFEQISQKRREILKINNAISSVEAGIIEDMISALRDLVPSWKKLKAAFKAFGKSGKNSLKETRKNFSDLVPLIAFTMGMLDANEKSAEFRALQEADKKAVREFNSLVKKLDEGKERQRHLLNQIAELDCLSR